VKGLKGRSIRLIVSVLLFNLFVFSGVSVIYGATKTLGVNNYSQEKSNWCWVAVSQMVVEYLNSEYHYQCTYYKWGKDTTSCDGNQPGTFITEVGRTLSHTGINRGYAGNGAIPFYTVVDEIDRSAPFMIRIGWKDDNGSLNGNGHMLVGRGYDTGNTSIYYIYPKQSGDDKDYTSEYRKHSYSYVKGNADWSWTNTRYQMN
jgi:hypothetical protein